MTRPRVLLVEDDSMLRQFVRMALDELEIELLEAGNVAAALALLAQAPAALVLTDLMMPGESGLDLLEHLRQRPELRGTAPVVVLSAGVNEEMRVRLQAYDVWRVLLKPVSVVQLLGCVEEALATIGRSEKEETSEAPAEKRASLTPQQRDALTTYFGGDLPLFEAYRASCHAQFPHDLEAGDQALLRGDLQSLRLLAHSLKTVLRTLGSPASELAQSLESTCHIGAAAEAAAQWGVLRGQLLAVTPPKP